MSNVNHVQHFRYICLRTHQPLPVDDQDALIPVVGDNAGLSPAVLQRSSKATFRKILPILIGVIFSCLLYSLLVTNVVLGVLEPRPSMVSGAAAMSKARLAQLRHSHSRGKDMQEYPQDFKEEYFCSMQDPSRTSEGENSAIRISK